MRIDPVVWDLEDDLAGNVRHIAEHGVTTDEVEEVLAAAEVVESSDSSGLPLVFGWTSTRKYLAVVFEIVEVVPRSVYPVTAYETEPPAETEVPSWNASIASEN